MLYFSPCSAMRQSYPLQCDNHAPAMPCHASANCTETSSFPCIHITETIASHHAFHAATSYTYKRHRSICISIVFRYKEAFALWLLQGHQSTPSESSSCNSNSSSVSLPAFWQRSMLIQLLRHLSKVSPILICQDATTPLLSI